MNGGNVGLDNENVFAKDLYSIATSYQEYLKLHTPRADRGQRLVFLFRDVLLKYLPKGIRPYDHIKISGLPCEWDLSLSRQESAVRAYKPTTLDASDVVAVFEVKAYGIFGTRALNLSKEERVEKALRNMSRRFVSAKKHCTSLSLMCYFSLQERTPRQAKSIQYYDLTKRFLEPHILTIIPFKSEIRADMHLPAMYPDCVDQWRRLVEGIRGLC